MTHTATKELATASIGFLLVGIDLRAGLFFAFGILTGVLITHMFHRHGRKKWTR